MASKVFFCDMRAVPKRGMLDKLQELLEHLEMSKQLTKNMLVGVKLHFGEKGNTAYIHPVMVARVIQHLKNLETKPFLTDCNTLYGGTRSDAPTHLVTAITNGFAYSVVGAPVVIADGLRGEASVEVALDNPACPKVYIGQQILAADALVVLTHFKCHELTGFGGAIKNLGMGCASRRGKLLQHSEISPVIDPAKCIACGECIRRCPAGAIRLLKRAADEPAPEGSLKPDSKAVTMNEKCIGCADCLLICQEEAIKIEWNAQVPTLLKRLAAHAWAAVKDKPDKCFYINFITNVSPACDCYPFQDAPIVADIGIAASTDPVAVDAACADLVNAAPGLASSCLKHAHAPGKDKFRDIYPEIDWNLQLAEAEAIGLGSREYELVRI